MDDIVGATPRAWVNFNGTGTVAIRASYNVSSITDNGEGSYTVNLTNPLSDTNYCVVGSVGQGSFAATPEFGTTKTTNSFSVLTAVVSTIAGDNRSPSDNQYVQAVAYR